jgi:hypothetical protein
METEHLMREIELYLRAVELFRSLGCEPSWRSSVPGVSSDVASPVAKPRATPFV